MKRWIYIWLLLALSACQPKDKSHPYTFYYWRTHLALDKQEADALQLSTAENLYVRYFDVDKKGGELIPVASATKAKHFKTQKTIVPVVFITNRSFVNISKNGIELLAKQVLHKIQSIHQAFSFNDFTEIQIDCDWTKGTKNDYFSFLRTLQSLSQKDITATLRLHQVKYSNSTGIPPVNKVYLMCYSTSSPLENSNKNSILNISLLKNYLADVDNYPIKHIDIALPIFSWAIVENHLGYHKLINGIALSDLEHPNFEKISKNEVSITKDGFYFGFYLNKGFTIKVESISKAMLQESVDFLNSKISTYNIIYYQLDHRFIEHKDLLL